MRQERISGSRIVALTVPYSDRVFNVSGSELDESVVGAIAKADGVWEPETMALMSRLIKPTDVCLDIGANVGVHTLVMGDLAPRGHVYSFEPSSSNFAHLKHNVEANGIANATVYHVGLSEAAGEREFHYFTNFAGCSFSGGGGEGPDIDEVMRQAWGEVWERVTETVPFTTLDIWAREKQLDKLDFIKMDVEGFERYVVQGGVDTLRRFRPKLLTEFNQKSLQSYYGIDPRSYYDLIKSIYPYMYNIENDGALTKINSYEQLSSKLTPQQFWADIVCVTEELNLSDEPGQTEARREPALRQAAMLDAMVVALATVVDDGRPASPEAAEAWLSRMLSKAVARVEGRAAVDRIRARRYFAHDPEVLAAVEQKRSAAIAALRDCFEAIGGPSSHLPRPPH